MHGHNASMEILENPPRAFWEDVARQSQAATPYHALLWPESLAAEYPDYQVAAIGCVFDDGTRALLPMLRSARGFLKRTVRYKSFGFGSYGGPIYTGSWDEEKAEALFSFFRDRTVSLHLDGNPLWPHGLPRYIKQEQNDTYALRLDRPLEDLYRGFSEAHRRGIKAAQKKGVTVRRGRSADDIEAYNALYADTLTRWGDATIIQFPESLTRRLLAHEGFAALWLAEADGRPIAGIIMLYWNRMAHYWRGASLRGFETYHANTLLQWSAIQDAARRGFALYDFAPSGPLAGVEEFKRRFGAEKITFIRGRLKR